MGLISDGEEKIAMSQNLGQQNSDSGFLVWNVQTQENGFMCKHKL